MFKCLVKFKGQEPVLFGIPNVAYASTLTTMDNVEWVLGPISDTGVLLEVTGARMRTSLMGEQTVKPFEPVVKAPHVCPQPRTSPKMIPMDIARNYLACVIQYLREGRKIQAIAVVRNDLFGGPSKCSLIQAKAIVEALEGFITPPF